MRVLSIYGVAGVLAAIATAPVVVVARQGTNSIPRSTHNNILLPGVLPWNPSHQIDDDGFLKDSYVRMAGEWEDLPEMYIAGRHNKKRAKLGHIPVRVRQVPGDGNCLFHAVSVCLYKSEHGCHFPFCDLQKLQQCSLSLRRKAVDYLKKKQRNLLFVQGREFLRAKDLTDAAAAPYGCTGEAYMDTMREPANWGGGPEIVALSNLLRRPIHVYELYAPSRHSQEFRLRRMCCFGSPKFDRQEALHILSADSRFPDVHPGKQKKEGNHFLAIFPQAKKPKRLQVRRGGQTINKVSGGGGTMATTTTRAGNEHFGEHEQFDLWIALPVKGLRSILMFCLGLFRL